MSFKSVVDCILIDGMMMKHKRALIWALIVILLCAANLKSVSFVYLLTFISLTFLNEEKGVYALYFAPVSRKSIVIGRYLFALSLFIITTLLNIAADIFIPFFYNEYVQSGSYFYLFAFAIFLLLISVGLPFFYWKGYTGARLFQLPVIFAILFLTVKVFDNKNIFELISSINIVSISIIIAVALLLTVCSILISMKIFERKNL